MTRLDFDLILIESFVHETKQSYFNGKREEFNCNVDEYCAGLKNSFDRHNEEVNRLDYYHAIVTTPEGVEKFHVLDKDLSLSEQTNNLWSIGNVTYPNKRTIVLKEEFRKGEIKELTAGIMAVLWVDLEKYLQSVAPVEPRQQTKADHSALYRALSGHVTGISPEEFTNIIENHKMTGTQKAKWIGSEKSQAAYFAKVFNITMPEFKKCFYFEDGSELTASIRPTTKKAFTNLLKPFLK